MGPTVTGSAGTFDEVVVLSFEDNGVAHLFKFVFPFRVITGGRAGSFFASVLTDSGTGFARTILDRVGFVGELP